VLRRGHRYLEFYFELVKLASGDTKLTDIDFRLDGLVSNMDARFLYRDITSGGKFKDGVVETGSANGDGDNLSDNYQIVYGKTDTNPFILGLATNRKPSHNTSGVFGYYSSNEWNMSSMLETGLSVTSGEVPIKFFPFVIPFPDLDQLFADAEVVGSPMAGTWVSVFDGGCSGTHFYTNDDAEGGSSAQNDEFRWKRAYIPKTGYYDIWMRGYTGTDMGIAHVEVDAVEKGTIDWYNAASAWDYKAVENVLIAQGCHDIDVKVATKNALSSDYELSIDAIYLVPKYTTNHAEDFPGDVAHQALRPLTIYTHVRRR